MTPKTCADVLWTTGCGKGNGGGSDLAWRYLKAIARDGLWNTADFIDLSTVADGCEVAYRDPDHARNWVATYYSGLEPNKANTRRRDAFLAFVDNGGYRKLAEVLRAVVAGRWFTLSVAMTSPSGITRKVTMDVWQEVQNKTGLRLTDSRRRKLTTSVAFADVPAPALAAA